MNKIQNLKGFQDYLPEEKRVRDYVTSQIIAVFELYGFEPIETPTLEYAKLLLGKYGDEADKLVYSFTDNGGREVALRYDQTVPTSRILAQYENELPKFFRRYQIQPVFRADKPQKGRYREFIQCDCDIYGTNSSVADAELLAVYYAVYQRLGLKSIQLRVNDRQTLLTTLSEFATQEVDVFSIIQSIDKLDKLSEEKVIQELIKKGLSAENATRVISSIQSATMSESLQTTLTQAQSLGVPESALIFTPTLARGLDYYTGIIFEGIIPEYSGGSVGGGGRYDKLIGDLSGREIQANGFAIGFDRTLEAIQELAPISKEKLQSTQVLVTLFSVDLVERSLQAATQLRNNGVSVEIYPELDKLGKQFKLANQKNIPFVLVIGESEAAENKAQLKDMKSGEQFLITLQEVIEKIG